MRHLYDYNMTFKKIQVRWNPVTKADINQLSPATVWFFRFLFHGDMLVICVQNPISNDFQNNSSKTNFCLSSRNRISDTCLDQTNKYISLNLITWRLDNTTVKFRQAACYMIFIWNVINNSNFALNWDLFWKMITLRGYDL